MSEIFIIKNTGKGVINSLAPENVVPIKSAGSSDGGVITEDSDTVSFTGNGTAGNPLSAESVGGGTSDLTLEQARQNGNILEGIVNFKSNNNNNLYFNGSDDGFEIGYETGSNLSAYFYNNPNIFIGLGKNEENGDLYQFGKDAVNNYFELKATNGKGIVGTEEFNKQGDRKAFAQLSDVYDSISYSTEEIKTGGTWIDGKPIYRKTFVGSQTNAETLTILINDILGNEFPIETLIKKEGCINRIDDSISYGLNSAHSQNNSVFVQDGLIINEGTRTWVHLESKSINMEYYSFDIDEMSMAIKIYLQFNYNVTLEYTKTTD